MTCTKAREVDLAAFAVDPGEPGWAAFLAHYPRCADCSEEVARVGALVAALRGEAAGATGHLTDAQILALSATRDGSLRPEERAGVELHLAGCAPCRTALAVVTGFDFGALGPVALTPSAAPGFGEALRRLAETLRRALPGPVLATALVVLVAVPAYLAWRALSRGEVREPGLARVETQAKPSTVPEAREPAPANEARPAPAPAPVEKPSPPQAAEPEAKPAAPTPAKTAPRPAAAPAKPAQQHAPAQKSGPEPEPRPVEIAALLPSEAPLYAPGALAGGASVRIGGSARGMVGTAPAPQVLAPLQLGQTVRESPTLYFFLPAATTQPIEVTVMDPNAVEPLLDATLPGPLAAGVHRVSLAERDARLAPGVAYQWHVALMVDPERRAQDIVSGAQIRYAPAAPVASVEPARRAHALAAAGLWYDAFDQLSTWLAAEPDAAVLHEYRAALLEQVGLDEAARYERPR